MAMPLGVAKIGLGTWQWLQARKDRKALEEAGRPEMAAELEAMQEARSKFESFGQETLGEYESLAREGMPEQARLNQEQNIGRTQANVLRQTSSLGGGLRGVQSAQNISNDAYRDLASQDAMMAQSNKQSLLQQRNLFNQGMLGINQNIAGLEGQAEQYNTLLPFEQQVAQQQALTGAATQNIFGGMNYINKKQQKDTENALKLLGTA